MELYKDSPFEFAKKIYFSVIDLNLTEIDLGSRFLNILLVVLRYTNPMEIKIVSLEMIVYKFLCKFKNN